MWYYKSSKKETDPRLREGTEVPVKPKYPLIKKEVGIGSVPDKHNRLWMHLSTASLLYTLGKLCRRDGILDITKGQKWI